MSTDHRNETIVLRFVHPKERPLFCQLPGKNITLINFHSPINTSMQGLQDMLTSIFVMIFPPSKQDIHDKLNYTVVSTPQLRTLITSHSQINTGKQGL